MTGVAPVPGGPAGPAFAAVDLGASSGRVVVGRVVDGPDGPRVDLDVVHRFPNGPVPVPVLAPGGRTALHWDVLHLWRGVLDGLRAAVASAGTLAGVGVDAWAVDVGLLDADGALLGNPLHYRDARTDGVPDRAFALVPAAELYARTGVQVLPFNTVFQLLAAHGTTQLAAARRALLVPDLLGAWLTGVEAAEVTNASTTGLLDAHTRAWAADLAARLGVDPTLLPPLREPGTLLGHVRDDLLAGVGHDGPLPVWTVGSHDTASAVVAVPAADDAFAYVSCGTWSLVGVETDTPVLSEASRAANFTNEAGVDGTVRYLRNVMGLWVLQETLRTWSQRGEAPDLDALLDAAGREPALACVVDLDSPAFLPPGDMPARIAAAAAASGQRPPGTPAAVVRCILDSLALAYRRAVREACALSGHEARVVHVVGGGSRNALLCRLTADATGLPVVAGPAEGSALGNVLVQARAAGALTGGLAALRDVAARSSTLTRYVPGEDGTPGADAWDAAAARLRTTVADRSRA